MRPAKRLSLEIENLSCASCVGRAEKALAAVEGVVEVTVNLATETATVQFTTPATTAGLAAALDRAGYPARRETTVLDVGAMSCAACVGRVERMLSATPGVLEARVNLATERAFVTYLGGAVTPDEMAIKPTKAGFPTTPRDEDGPRVDSKAQDARRLGQAAMVAALLAAPVFVLEMGGHVFPGFHHWIAANIGMRVSHVIQMILTALVLAGPGRLFFTKGVPALLRGAPDMNALVALGTSAAFLYSAVATIAPKALPAGTANVYFEAAAVIVVLILCGRVMEARAKGQTGEAIRALVALQPHDALVEIDDATVTRPIAQVVTGEVLLVKPGARVPLDGEVISGTSYMDEAMITGEPDPVAKSPGDTVVGGTVNGAGSLRVKVTKTGPDTMLSQIIRMVEDAQGAKLPIQALVDRVTAVFVPAVMGIAAVTVLIWLLIGPTPALGLALVAGVSVLIIACPCAMGLATPTSIMVGTGRAAQLGALFRRGDALQMLQDAQVVAFDKTGTLTAGRPELTEFLLAPEQDADAVLAMIAAVEAESEHPLAQAITRGAAARGIKAPKARAFQAEVGMGVHGIVDGKTVLIGSQPFMVREGVPLTDLAEQAGPLRAQGHSVFFAAVEGVLVALIGVSDPIKPDTKPALDALHDQGKKLAMITGDDAGTAAAIAKQLGIDHVVAGVLPGGKVYALQSLRADFGPVAFVGDGINDAPALAEADVGLAIGSGTDVAIEAADVVLSSDSLSGVVNAFDISHRTMGNIRQNLIWAFGYNVILIPVAAGLLFPIWGIMLSPMLGAFAMAASSVMVLTNALRLRWVKPVL